MAISLTSDGVTLVYNHLRDAKHLIATATLGSVQRWFKFTVFRKLAGARTDIMSGTITHSRQIDYTIDSKSERRTQTWSATLVGHSLVDIVEIRKDFRQMAAFVETSQFAEWLASRTEF